MEPTPLNFSLTFQSLLGARMDESGAADDVRSGEAEHRLAGAALPALSEYRLQLMQHLAAADPARMAAAQHDAGRRAGADDDDACGSPYSCAGVGGASARHDGAGGVADMRELGLDAQGFDTLDAAANLLLFSATAALIHGPRRAQLAEQGVGGL